MVSKLGEKLFPKDTRFEQRRKVILLFLTLLGILLLIGGVAVVMVLISQVNFQNQ